MQNAPGTRGLSRRNTGFEADRIRLLFRPNVRTSLAPENAGRARRVQGGALHDVDQVSRCTADSEATWSAGMREVSR